MYFKGRADRISYQLSDVGQEVDRVTPRFESEHLEPSFPESGELWVGPGPRCALCPFPESPLLTPSPPQPLLGQGMEGESENSAPPRPPGRKGAPRAWPQGDTTFNNFAAESFAMGALYRLLKRVGFCNHPNG